LSHKWHLVEEKDVKNHQKNYSFKAPSTPKSSSTTQNHGFFYQGFPTTLYCEPLNVSMNCEHEHVSNVEFFKHLLMMRMEYAKNILCHIGQNLY
jgi:hypothetical protein